MKIGVKLMVGFMVMFLVVAIMGYVGMARTRGVGDEFKAVSEHTFPVVQALDRIVVSGWKIIASTNEYVLLSSQGSVLSDDQQVNLLRLALLEEQESIAAGEKEYQQALDMYVLLLQETAVVDENDYLDRIKEAGGILIELSGRLIDQADAEPDVAIFDLKEEFEDAEVDFAAAVDAALAHEQVELEERKGAVSAAVSSASRSVLLISIVGLVAAVLVGLVLSQVISRPLRRLTATIEEISKGRIDAQIDPLLKESKDEIGALAQAFDRTVVSLKLAMKKGTTQKAQEKKVEKG